MAATKHMDAPDEVRAFDKGHIEVAEVNGQMVGRATFKPGWRWSECVKPLIGTELCEVEHLVYMVSGDMHLEYRDGTTQDLTSGDVAHMPAGHDAWIVGDDDCVVIDFMGGSAYARS